MSTRALVFRAGPLLCALGLDQVIETMRPLPVRPLAGTPDFIAGLCVMRGTPVPVVDVAYLLSGAGPDRSGPAAARFIAVRAGDATLVLATGPVVDIREITLPGAGPGGGLPGRSPAVTGIGNIEAEPLLFLDAREIMSEPVPAAALTGAA